MKKTVSAAVSEHALVHDINEDQSLANDRLGLYVVCDGDEGAVAGEVASRVAVEAAGAFMEKHLDKGLFPTRISDALVARAIHHAFAKVYDASLEEPVLQGMNTTLTMMLARNKRAVVGHVGDSRLYLVRRGQLSQLTVDHDITEQMPMEPGHADDIDVDTFSVLLFPGDIFFLCTDGLNHVMLEEEWVVSIAQQTGLAWIARQLIARAHELDPAEDSTVVVVRVEEEDGPPFAHFMTAGLPA